MVPQAGNAISKRTGRSVDSFARRRSAVRARPRPIDATTDATSVRRISPSRNAKRLAGPEWFSEPLHFPNAGLAYLGELAVRATTASAGNSAYFQILLETFERHHP